MSAANPFYLSESEDCEEAQSSEEESSLSGIKVIALTREGTAR